MGTLTALPETVIVLVSLLKGLGGIASGSALGGSFALLTVGTAILCGFVILKSGRAVEVGRGIVDLEVLLSLASLVYLALISSRGVAGIIPSIPLFLAYSLYIILKLRDRKPIPDLPEEGESLGLKLRAVAYGVVGSVMVLIASPYLSQSIEVVAMGSGISPSWLSLIISPVAAEIEEILSGIVMVAHFGNERVGTAVLGFAGSKVQNTTFLVGIVVAAGGVSFSSSFPEVLAALISTIVFYLSIMDGKIGKWDLLLQLVSFVAMSFLSLVFP